MPNPTTVTVRELTAKGEVVERMVAYDKRAMIYNPTTKQLLPLAKPPAVELAELRKEVADLRASMKLMALAIEKLNGR